MEFLCIRCRLDIYGRSAEEYEAHMAFHLELDREPKSYSDDRALYERFAAPPRPMDRYFMTER
jgi:hypothetical protein